MLYSIRLELDAASEPDEAERIVDALAGYHPAVGLASARMAVTVSLPAESLALAASTAIAVVEGATRHRALAIAAATADHFDRANGLEPLPELVSVADAAALLKISRQALVRALAHGKYPTAQKVGSVWVIPREAIKVPETYDLFPGLIDAEEGR